MAEHDHLTPDGTIWNSAPAAPIEPAPVASLADAAVPRVTLLPGDILAVRGITRVDPPVDEDWIVVTFQVRDRLGDGPGEYVSIHLGDRVLTVEPPDVAPAAFTVEGPHETITVTSVPDAVERPARKVAKE